MPCLNKAILVGNLGQDPEMRYTTDGTAVGSFSIATSYGSGDARKTDWHKIVVWAKTAEFVKEYCRKGNMVLVEGRIQYRSYDDKDGVKRYVTEIVASNIQLLSGSPKSDEENPQGDMPF